MPLDRWERTDSFELVFDEIIVRVRGTLADSGAIAREGKAYIRRRVLIHSRAIGGK